MTCKVVYFSKTGNTKKVANAIAEELGCEAETAETELVTGETDVLFVGGAVYATSDHDFDPALKKYINGLDATKIKKVAAFGTYAFASSIDKLIHFIKDCGLTVSAEYFVCKGKFLFFNRKAPGERDLLKAKEFARKIIGKN